jgi:hypothetical protein
MRWSALRVPGGNQVDGLPPARHTEPRWIGQTMDPRRSVILVDIFMFLVIFHIRSYWFVTFRSFISYWSLILCEYQLWWSMKPLFSTPGRVGQNVEKWWKFSKNMKKSIFQSKTSPFQEFPNFSFLKILLFFESIYVFDCVNN